jgi:hypothetical protein
MGLPGPEAIADGDAREPCLLGYRTAFDEVRDGARLVSQHETDLACLPG